MGESSSAARVGDGSELARSVVSTAITSSKDSNTAFSLVSLVSLKAAPIDSNGSWRDFLIRDVTISWYLKLFSPDSIRERTKADARRLFDC